MNNPGNDALSLAQRLEHMLDVCPPAKPEQAVLDTEILQRLRTTIDEVIGLQRLRSKLSMAQAKVSGDVLILIFETGLPCWDDIETTHWLAFSQVCRHWRTVALGHPSLWTRFDTRSRELSTMVSRGFLLDASTCTYQGDQILERTTPDSLLDCRVDLRCRPRRVHELPICIAHIAERIHTLFILVDDSYVHAQTGTSSLRLPNLRRVAMISPGRDQGLGSRPGLFRVSCAFPDPIVRSIGVGPQRLTSLQLTRVREVDWDAVPSFEGLESLVLQDVESALSVTQLERLIRASAASLRVLRLHRVIGAAHASWAPYVLHLPRLQRLDAFCRSWSTLGNIFSLLDPSAEAEMHLVVLDTPTPSPCPALQAFQDRAERGTCSAWTIAWTTQDLIFCAAPRDARHILSLKVLRPVEKHVPRWRAGNVNVWNRKVLLLLEQVLQAVTDLQLYVVPSLVAETKLLSLLRRCDQLSSLTLAEGHLLEPFLPHLLPDPTGAASANGSRMPLPNLMSIGFVEAWLFPQRCALLKDTLLRRHALGGSLLTLVLGNRTYVLEDSYRDLSAAINIETCGVVRILAGDKREVTMASLAAQHLQNSKLY
jgi:hypothetical protein